MIRGGIEGAVGRIGLDRPEAHDALDRNAMRVTACFACADQAEGWRRSASAGLGASPGGDPEPDRSRPMIRHLVLLRFRPDVTETGRAALMAELDALRARLPGMLSFARLSNISTEIPVVHGFQDGFAIELADEAARDAYLIDPEHRAIGARLVAACAGGAEGLIVFDHAL